MVRENCYTNKFIARLAQIIIVGCASHLFNLAVCNILDEYSNMLEEILSLMTKLNTPNIRSRLRQHIFFSLNSPKVSRWSSSFDMVLRYTKLCEYLPPLENGDVDAFLLTPSKNGRVCSVLESLKDLESIQKKLFNNNTIIRFFRGLFNFVIDSYPCSSSNFSNDSNIIHYPRFQSALVPVQLVNCTSSSREDRLGLDKFVVSEYIQSDSDGDEESFTGRAFKRQRRSSKIGPVLYTDTRYALPTFDLCELFFSVAGHVLDLTCMSFLPANLECQLFLNLK